MTTETKDTKQLALEAIANMEVTPETDVRQLLTLAIAIARVEMANDFDSMLAALDAEITALRNA